MGEIKIERKGWGGKKEGNVCHCKSQSLTHKSPGIYKVWSQQTVIDFN